MSNRRLIMLGALVGFSAALVGCAATPARPVFVAPGCYRVNDATRYDARQVHLKEDGTYYAELQGHMTLWGSGMGTWRTEGDQVVLSPQHVDGQPPLPDRLIVEHDAHGVALRIPNGGILWKAPLAATSCDAVTWWGTSLGRVGAAAGQPDSSGLMPALADSGRRNYSGALDA